MVAVEERNLETSFIGGGCAGCGSSVGKGIRQHLKWGCMVAEVVVIALNSAIPGPFLTKVLVEP